MGLPTLVISLVMTLYEYIVGMACMGGSEMEGIHSSIEIKQGCLLSLYLFLFTLMFKRRSYFLFGFPIAIVLFANEIILMYHLLNNFHR